IYLGLAPLSPRTGLPSSGVPDPGCVVVAQRNYSATIRVELRPPDIRSVPKRWNSDLTGSGVIDARGIVATCRDGQLPVWAEFSIGDNVLMHQRCRVWLPG